MNTKEEVENQIKIADITKRGLEIDNYIPSKITTGDVLIKLNDNNKSILEIGNIKVYNTKKFNWLQRKMFKIFFGIKINNLESKGEDE